MLTPFGVADGVSMALVCTYTSNGRDLPRKRLLRCCPLKSVSFLLMIDWGEVVVAECSRYLPQYLSKVGALPD